ncbi:glycosyl hydrolase [Sphingopyxis sp. GW247-27LB]|uniref:glycosyl hydrolase n=1 Tax=Sphingopyxis sp. GW247-27LB TaxID=2012632 RepID=UPI000BA61897|nr:glycosyl hydrolase [Sphingopyxis sp. GW247-27LB]PAL21762.1 alpha-L-arabinofuranosidase [Sphingopyxis sp. GW247-27LB]
MARFGYWLAGSALILLPIWSAAAQTASDGPTPEAFRDPPAEARPGTFYHWMNGNVTAAGLDADLASMHEIGLGSVMAFDGSNDVPKGPVDYLSPHWLELMTHMMDKADRLGLKVGMHNAPGWSSSGGPWITPDRSMQQISWTETTVAGGKPLRLKLPRPYAKRGYYRDAAVLAYPASAGDDSVYRDAVQSMRAALDIAPATLTDRDLHSAAEITPAAPLVVTMKRPFAAQSVTLYGDADSGPFTATIEASQDGKNWTRIGQVSAPVQHERGIEAPGTLNFPAVEARYFRVTPKAGVKLAEALFHATPRIDDWGAKAEHLYRPPTAVETHPTDLRAGDAIDPAKVIDITANLGADGTLVWAPPPGRWTILRFGHTTTGHLNVAASDAGRGLEVDKLSASSVDFQFENSVQRMLKAAGPLAGKTFDSLMIDSYEAGLQNWTPDLPAEFSKRAGYAITPYLPALTGRIVGDLDASNRFLFDFRRTLADLTADNYYGRMQEHARAAGLNFHVEAYGPGPFDSLQVSGLVDVPSTEFWTRTPWTDNRTVKMVASAAHTYGRPVVAAESFTGEAETSRWQDYPYALKTLGDQMFVQGVNKILFHRYAHQPNPNAAPGMTMGPWGVNLDRSNTWFGQARPWIDYLARSQYMLRQGHYVADVLFFVGEETPNQAEYVRPDVSPDTNPKIGQYFDPQMPPGGYNYDLVNAEVLLTRASVKDGRIVLPNGASYRLLVLPATLSSMTPKLAARLRSLVEQGAAILGPKPEHSMTLAGKADGDAAFRGAIDGLWGSASPDAAPRKVGAGTVFAQGSIADALAALKVAPDAQCRTRTPDGQLVWMHRALTGRDMYFVANRQRRAETVTCTFRVGEAAPALWDAETGTITRPALFETGRDATTVTFDLTPAGSTFVMLGDAAGAKGIGWIARDGQRIAAVDPGPAARAEAPADSFTLSLWAKPDIDLRVMPDETVDGRINETGKNYLINARSGRDMHGDGTAVAGLALGRNGAFVIERESPDSVPAVLVSHAPVAGWTHVALVYDRGTPSLYLNGKLVRTGRKSGRRVFAGGSDAPSPNGVTYFFEGNATPLATVPRALSAAEIASEAAGGPPAAPIAATPVVLERGGDGRLQALAWESGRYTVEGGGSFTAKVPAPITVEGAWAVRFQPGRGAPEAITLPRLASLSRHADDGVRHFSGTATYERTIDVPAAALRKGRRVFLDLGRVEVLSGVKVNGTDLGVVWKEPYRVDITDVVKPGANRVSLAVTNLWTNRMIADAALPEEGPFVDAEWPVGERFSADGKKTPVMARKITALPEWYKAGEAKPAGGRVTFSTWTFYGKDEPLLDSGLLGPVRILFADEVTVK